MAAVAAELIHGGFIDTGSLSLRDLEIGRRPYHRNCSCALHNLKGTVCASACSRKSNISFPKKQAWSTDRSLCIAASKFSSQSFILDKTSIITREIANEDCNIQGMMELKEEKGGNQ